MNIFQIKSFRQSASGSYTIKCQFILEKIKLNPFFFKRLKVYRGITISFEGNSIKQHEAAEHLVCQLKSKLTGETMVSKVLKKKNDKLKFLCRQSKYLTPPYRILLCNVLIQPYFDYGCFSWFSLLNKNLRIKL